MIVLPLSRGIAPDQVVEHAALRAEAADRAGLMHVEMRRPIE